MCFSDLGYIHLLGYTGQALWLVGFRDRYPTCNIGLSETGDNVMFSEYQYEKNERSFIDVLVPFIIDCELLFMKIYSTCIKLQE